MDIKIISYFYHHLIIAFQTCKTYKVKAIKDDTNQRRNIQIQDETWITNQTRTQR